RTPRRGSSLEEPRSYQEIHQWLKWSTVLMGSLKKAFRVKTDMGASHHDNILLVPFFDDPGNL
ncbi:MAG: hypothetical protein Q7U55_00065, partial [Deltaproteobacteria bacterium]|nr:hypothetical protein [Deltaproteobacteria bacterium]